MNYSLSSRLFHFKQPAGTSRGVYTTRRSWFVTFTDPSRPGAEGVGECAPLPNLSCDDIPDYAEVLARLCDRVAATGRIDEDLLRPYPSMLFGIETALRDLYSDNGVIFDTPFTQGQVGIPINGLVWMGSHEEMLARMEEKIRQRFRCVKFKIGAIDFEEELDLIRRVRERFSPSEVEIRLDANGAFTPSEALEKLQRLSSFGIHSIEQPIRQHQWRDMANLCRLSPIPIALDEELIGVNLKAMKEDLLDTIRPAYIILKPSLHGGMIGTEEWVDLAARRGIGSWMTSALESNVGLSAIAQLAAKIYGCPPSMPQGLGTGMLFTDNINRPIKIVGSQLWFEGVNSHS